MTENSNTNTGADATVDLGAMTPSAARDKLADLTADKKWTDKLMAGDGPTRREFEALSARKVEADRFDAALAGTLEPQPFETVTDGNLSSANLAQMVGWLKEAGLHPETIREAHDGKAVTAEYKAEAERFGSQLLSNADWKKRLFAGDLEARRQLIALHVIRRAPIETKAA